MILLTTELTKRQIDWVVAKCEDLQGKGLDWVPPMYSTYWRQGGPIIEREGICLTYDPFVKRWNAVCGSGDSYHADTPLIAAMRCYVQSKMGDEVEIPEELQ